MDNFSRKLLWGIPWGIFVVTVLSLSGFTTTSNLETWFLGFLFKVRGEIRPSPEIVLISIGESDLETLGPWQWPRSYHATMLEVLKDLGVKAIGYDILFLDPDANNPEGDGQFVDTLSWMDNVVLPIVVEHPEQSAPVATYPYAEIRDAAPLLGYVNLSLTKDKDAITIDLRRGDFSYFGLQLLKNYLSAPADAVVVDPGRILIAGKERNVRIPTGDDTRASINYAGPTNIWTWYGFSEVLNAYKKQRAGGTPGFPLSEFKDKIALIGATDTHMGDIWAQPYGLSYGVEVHANFLNSALQDNFLVRLPKNANRLVAYAVIMLVCSLLMLARLRHGMAAVLVTITSIVATSYILFSRMNVWIDTVNLSLSVILTIIPIYCTKYVLERRRRDFTRKALCLYLSPRVVREIERSPDKLNLGGERRNLTAMFTDLADFSTFSENLPPDALVRLLNEYLSEMTDIILRNDGTVDKYAGDAIIAFYGAPISCDNHPLQACVTALEMQSRLRELAPAWRERGYPELRMRIGINTGEMVVGNMGSRQRMDYTVMGDAVNLASRLEGVNKIYGTGILISHQTWEKVSGDLVCREIDSVRVLGKSTATRIYEIVGAKEDDCADSVRLLLRHYGEGLACYRRGDWERAIDAFDRALNEVEHDPPAVVLKSRCSEYSRNAPAEPWDGVYDVKVK